MVATRFSIRSYSLNARAHAHRHHQLVLPLQGVIEIRTNGHQGRIGMGHCVVILAGHEHWFSAAEQARFLVADTSTLPHRMLSLPTPFVSVSAPLQAFCRFVETQLQHQLNPELENRMGTLFEQLLAEQAFQPRIDPRIARVLDWLEADLRRTPTLAELASHACLSLSHYKALFQQEIGQSTGQYLLRLRMDKARALLAHTDYPVHIIAETVGYQDVSAFSRRFSAYFGQSPRHFAGR